MKYYVQASAAVGLAVLICAGAAVWWKDRSSAVDAAVRRRAELQTRLTEAQNASAMTARLREIETVNIAQWSNLVERLTEPRREGARLLEEVVRAASTSGVEVVAASESTRPPPVSAAPDTMAAASYLLSTRGSYAGITRFAAELAAARVALRVESVEITPDPSSTDRKILLAEIGVVVFSRVDQPPKGP